MAIIGNLVVLMTARTAKFRKKMKGARKTMKQFGSAAALAATAVAAATAAMVASQLEAIDKLAKLSRALGVTADQLHALRFAAQIGGVATEQMDKALKRLVKSVSDASRGLSTAVDAFATLGLTVDGIKNLSTDEVFKQIADRVKTLGVNAQTTGAIMDIFGSRVGADLVNVLLAGREGIEGFEKEIEAMGLAMSAVDTAAVESANDAWTRFKKVAGAVAQKFTVTLAPAISVIIKVLTSSEERVKKVGEAVVWLGKAVTEIVGGIGNVVQAVKIGFHAAATAIMNGINLVVKGLALIGVVSKETAAAWQEQTDVMASTTLEMINAKWFSERLREELELQKKAAEEAAGAADATKKSYEEMAEAARAAAEAQKEMNKLQRDAERIFKQTRTPLERYKSDMELLNKLLKKGLIDQETFTRAVQRAKEALERATGTGDAPADKAPRTRDFEQVVLSRIALGGVAASDPERERLERIAEWLKQIKENQERFASQPMIFKWA